MQKIFDALARALASLMHPQMLLLCFAPLLLALLVWLGVVALSWDDGWMWMRSTVEGGLGGAGLAAGTSSGPWAGRVEPPDWMHGMVSLDGEAIAGGLLAVATTALLLVLLVPAVWMTALLMFALIAMPWTVSLVGRRDYPGLERMEGGNWLASLWNAFTAVAVFVVLWLLTLPLWLLGGLGALLGLGLTGWVTQRLLRYDALSSHATAAEMRLVFERAGGRLWLLGIVITLLAVVPLFNLLLPVYAGLAVTHLCLTELAEVRRDGVVVG